jgi:hypothetical protein
MWRRPSPSSIDTFSAHENKPESEACKPIELRCKRSISNASARVSLLSGPTGPRQSSRQYGYQRIRRESVKNRTEDYRTDDYHDHEMGAR